MVRLSVTHKSPCFWFGHRAAVLGNNSRSVFSVPTSVALFFVGGKASEDDRSLQTTFRAAVFGRGEKSKA